MKITKRQLKRIVLENDRREELISVIYDIMMDNRTGDQEEDFAAAKDEMELDGEATPTELRDIQLGDILQMRGPLAMEQKTVKITRRQLRRLIREAQWPSYAQKGSSEYSDVIMMSPNGDSVLVNGTETYVEDVPQELSIASGFPMSETDSDNLIFALQDQMSDGYVELSVEYTNGKWGW